MPFTLTKAHSLIRHDFQGRRLPFNITVDDLINNGLSNLKKYILQPVQDGYRLTEYLPPTHTSRYRPPTTIEAPPQPQSFLITHAPPHISWSKK